MHPRLLLSAKLRRDFRAAAARRRTLIDFDESSVARRQLEAVSRTWTEATAEIPYYASLVAARQAPKKIESWSDFHAIPPLTRQDIQNRPDDFLRRSKQPDDFVRTAGSTGTPLRIGVTQSEREYMRVVKLAAWQEFGYTSTSRLFLIWGHAHLFGPGWAGRVNHIKRRVADAFLGYRRVNAYELNRASCIGYAEEMLRFRPLGVIGYGVALDQFVRYTSEFWSRFRALGLQFVLTTSEMLPRPDTLPRLEEAFGCPIVQEYGGAEFGQLAFKNGARPFEVYSDLNYVECESPDKGLPGRPVLMTTLYNRYVPLVRYRVGDTLDDPECLPHGHVIRFGNVVGRVHDVVELESGDFIHSTSIYHCIQQEPAVLSIQLVLKDEGIELRLVSTDIDNAELEERLRRNLAQVHPKLALIRFKYVEDLQANRAGKRRWIVDDRSRVQATA